MSWIPNIRVQRFFQQLLVNFRQIVSNVRHFGGALFQWLFCGRWNNREPQLERGLNQAINHHNNEAQTRRSSLHREGGKNIKEPVENDEALSCELSYIGTLCCATKRFCEESYRVTSPLE
ncbi:unnamed protein product [Porites lobata]|uniref:Uncharacterized protein n=1 Tax=Porites lobata TaxID=104759 RepID=A0ABN8N808_9CNID|nr:unnamed protein product [Porites lobata]